MALNQTVVLGALALLLSACPVNLGENVVEVDAGVDASTRPDARAPGFRDGEACRVTPEDARGGCAPDYACVDFIGGLARCRKTCPTLQVSCLGYTGPGFPICTLTYTDVNDQVIGNVCNVICGDENNTLNGCQNGACDGTCPGDWVCENDPVNTGLKSCQ